jgi:hypothetical protein
MDKILDLMPIRWKNKSAESSQSPKYVLEFSLAADSAEEDADPYPGESPVLSLASEGGDYIVRIFPKASGNGATAILLKGVPSSKAQANMNSSDSEMEFLLRIGDIEYAFDEDGLLSLPEFPAPSIQIVVRSNNESSH